MGHCARSFTHLGSGPLTLDTVSGARETELVVRNGRALNKMRVLQPFLAQRTLERGRVVVGGGSGGGCGGSRRRVGQRYGRGGRRQGHRGRAAVHWCGAGRAVGAAATGRRGVCGACARTAAAAVSGWPAAAATTRPAAVTTATGAAAGCPCAAGRPAAVGLARRYRCRTDVPATRRPTSARRTATFKTKIVSTTKHYHLVFLYTCIE